MASTEPEGAEICGRRRAGHRVSAGLRTPRPPRVRARSRGELELAFRKGRLFVCQRRSSLAVIVFRPAGKERTGVHERFLAGVDPETKAGLTVSCGCGPAAVDARGAHRLLQHRNVGKLMKAIREVARSEEVICGRSPPADDPLPAWVSAAGRQVTDHHMLCRLDLLGPRRLGERAREGSRS